MGAADRETPRLTLWLTRRKPPVVLPAMPRGGDSPNGGALFEAANKLRGSVESAEYKHLVLGLIFLKYISDAFEQRRGQLETELSDPAGDGFTADPEGRAEILEDRDEYVAENVFWVPEEGAIHFRPPGVVA